MAVAFVKNVGSKTGGNVSSLAVTVPAAGVALGNLLVVRTSANDGTGSVSSITDTAGNTYSEFRSRPHTTAAEELFVWRSGTTGALVSGNTITVTFSKMGGHEAVIDEFSGVTLPATADVIGDTDGTSSTPSASAVQTNSVDLCIGALGIPGGATVTEDGDSSGGDTWHTLTSAVGNGGVYGAYKVTTSSVTQTYNPTLGASADWVDILVAIIGTTSGVTPKVKAGYGVENRVA